MRGGGGAEEGEGGEAHPEVERRLEERELNVGVDGADEHAENTVHRRRVEAGCED